MQFPEIAFTIPLKKGHVVICTLWGRTGIVKELLGFGWLVHWLEDDVLEIVMNRGLLAKGKAN